MKMNEAAKITVQNLLTVKSIVTIMLTVVFFVSGSGGAHQRRTVFDDFLCGGGVLLRDAVSEGERRCRGWGMKKDREGRS